jgi:hypothetical protein
MSIEALLLVALVDCFAAAFLRVFLLFCTTFGLAAFFFFFFAAPPHPHMPPPLLACTVPSAAAAAAKTPEWLRRMPGCGVPVGEMELDVDDDESGDESAEDFVDVVVSSKFAVGESGTGALPNNERNQFSEAVKPRLNEAMPRRV